LRILYNNININFKIEKNENYIVEDKHLYSSVKIEILKRKE